MLLHPNDLTVGASGAVFGLMGFAFMAMRARGIDPFSTGLGGTILINLVLTFTLSGYISVGGHVGGLIGGFVCGWVLIDLGPKHLKDERAILAVGGRPSAPRAFVAAILRRVSRVRSGRRGGGGCASTPSGARAC